VEGVKCDGARILKSRAERSSEHRAFHADRHFDFGLGGGDGERFWTLGDTVGSTSGLEFDGEVTSGDSKDL